MKISWKIDFIRSIKLLSYISIHFLNYSAAFLAFSPDSSIYFYLQLAVTPAKSLAVFYLNINAYFTHTYTQANMKRCTQKKVVNTKDEFRIAKMLVDMLNMKRTLHGIVTMIQLEDSHKPLYDSFWINNGTVLWFRVEFLCHLWFHILFFSFSFIFHCYWIQHVEKRCKMQTDCDPNYRRFEYDILWLV